ncbi:MAG TPA: phosphate signaling complex protein PhoU [Mycobacterium sp.]|nr:phosphate signaling complex protein PhoU [Mycobacterium sp.]
MRTAYQQQLEALTARLCEMCRMATDAISRATDALLQPDLELAESVILAQEDIAAMSAQAEEIAVRLLALQAPVAADLRAVVSALQIAADAERMGGLAAHIAKIARRRFPSHAVPAEVEGYFAEMGAVAVALGTGAFEVLCSRDPSKAAQIHRDDDTMDDLRRQTLTVLVDPGWEHGVGAAVDLALLGRFYERFADHAVQIARRVIFQATGSYEHPSILL